MTFRLQNDVISIPKMMIWLVCVLTAASPIWVMAPYWYIPYGLLVAWFVLIVASYAIMLCTFESTMEIMRPHFETKLKRRAFYEYVACIVITFLFVVQGHWIAAGLAGTATALGIIWRLMLEREVAKYRRTLH